MLNHGRLFRHLDMRLDRCRLVDSNDLLDIRQNHPIRTTDFHLGCFAAHNFHHILHDMYMLDTHCHYSICYQLKYLDHYQYPMLVRKRDSNLLSHPHQHQMYHPLGIRVQYHLHNMTPADNHLGHLYHRHPDKPDHLHMVYMLPWLCLDWLRDILRYMSRDMYMLDTHCQNNIPCC